MDYAEIEERVLKYVEAVSAKTPVRVMTRNGVEWTAAMGPGPVDIIYQPVPLREHEREAIREILDGDPIAIVGLRDPLRAHVLWGLWRWGSNTALLRGMVAEVWQHNHREMLFLFPQRGTMCEPTLRELFKAAEFPVGHLPEQVKIYRGVAAKDPELPSGSGIAWTLRRDLACWFARHLPGPGGSGMFAVPAGWTSYLLAATVGRDRIAAHLTDRNEDEVIVFGMSARTVTLSSDLDDILAGEAREWERRRINDARADEYLCG